MAFLQALLYITEYLFITSPIIFIKSIKIPLFIKLQLNKKHYFIILLYYWCILCACKYRLLKINLF